MTIDRNSAPAPCRGPVVRPPVTIGQRDTLFGAIQVHDTIRLDATLPPAIHLDYDTDRLARCFALSQALWEHGSDRRALAGIAATLARGHPLGDAAQQDYKDIRARFKQLRFAWVVFDQRHDYPLALHWITRAMGRLQDALKNGHTRAAARHAMVLRLLASPLPYAVVERAWQRFRSCGAGSLRDWVRHELDAVRALLAEPQVTAKQFHEVRKVASRLVALYDSVNTLYPSAYHRDIVHYLSTINGMMGGMHDGMIERKLNGAQDYHAETFVLPEPVAARLRTLERTFAAADQSAGAV